MVFDGLCCLGCEEEGLKIGLIASEGVLHFGKFLFENEIHLPLFFDMLLQLVRGCFLEVGEFV